MAQTRSKSKGKPVMSKHIKKKHANCVQYLETYKLLIKKFKEFKKIEMNLVEYLLKQSNNNSTFENTNLYLKKLNAFIKLEEEVNELKNSLLAMKSCDKKFFNMYEDYLNNIANNLR